MLPIFQIHYIDHANYTVRLAHRGHHGYNCAFSQTFRQLVYAVFHCDEVKEAFRSSKFYNGIFDMDTLDETETRRWLFSYTRGNYPIINYLTVVEFVISLRGLPIENQSIPAIWVT
jgi:hypothetical protein